MSDEAFHVAPAGEKQHFIKCGECGVMYARANWTRLATINAHQAEYLREKYNQLTMSDAVVTD